MSEIQSVLGPVAPGDLGVTYPHEHLLVDLFRGFQPHREFLLNDVDLAVEELSYFKSAGGSTIVDVTTPDLGRDPVGLVEIAQRASINVIMGTGRYRHTFYEDAIQTITTAQLAEMFIGELQEGVDGIRAGIIGEIGTHERFISPSEERVHRAAARAQSVTGVAITTHSNASDVGLAQLDLFDEEGIDLRRVVVGHCDTYPFLGYHRAILERGAYVQFDTVRGNFEFETRRQIEHILALSADGYLDRILLSQDMASNRFYKAYGGRGFDFLLSDFTEELQSNGLSPEQVHMLTVVNPARMLTGEDLD